MLCPNKPVFYFLTGLDLAYCIGEETFYRGLETYHSRPFLLRDQVSTGEN